MTLLGRPVRVALRLGEALALSALAGALVWLLALVVRLPIVLHPLLGFLAGGSATMRTLGVTVRSRRRRVGLALACVAAATLVYRGLEYRRFVDAMRRQQIAADYRLDPAEVDRRIQAELRHLTGLAGPAGYVLAAVRSGGPWVGVLWLVELAVAAAVAARWAAGPRPPAGAIRSGT